MTNRQFALRKNPFGRWIVVNAEYPWLAWSGSRWVPLGGNVQISNFEWRTEAVRYASEFGFMERPHDISAT
jgi:hypothetical protein